MKTHVVIALALLFLGWPLTARADDSSVSAVPTASPAPTFDVEMGAEHASLTNGRGESDTQYARFVRRDGNRAFHAQALATTRFGQYDSQYTAGAFIPWGPRWTAVLEASTSPTHRVLPSHSVMGGLQYASGGNWFETLSFRSTSYSENSVGTATFALEHHWRAFRISYAVHVADLAFNGTSVEHAVRLDHYYGAQPSFVGVSYVAGRDVEDIGLPQVVTSTVHGWNVFGRHWLNERWAVAYGFNHLVQGAFYAQTGGDLGLRYRL